MSLAAADLPGVRRGAAGRSAVTDGAVAIGDVPAGEWRALADSALADNVFFGPAFLTAAAAGLGAGVSAVEVRGTSGELAGLLLVAHARLGRIAPVVRAFAHEYGPLGVPLVAAGAGDAAIRDLVAGAVALAGAARGVVIPDLPVDGPLLVALETAADGAGRSVRRIDTYRRAMLERSAGTDPRRSLVARRRKEYARLLRRMADLGPVTVTEATTPAEVATSFEAFLDLERAGWKGRRGTALADLPKVAAFGRAAVNGLAAEGNARIVSLSVDGKPAAMVVCLVAGRTAFTWKIAYDEALARFSPGAQLMLEAPRLLFADPRIDRIDSCAAPNHPMIDHLWPGRLELTTLVIGPGRRRWLAAAGLAAHAAERAARDTLKKMRRPKVRGES